MEKKTVSKFCPKKRFRNSHGKTIPKNAFEIKRLKNSWRKNDLELKRFQKTAMQKHRRHKTKWERITARNKV